MRRYLILSTQGISCLMQETLTTVKVVKTPRIAAGTLHRKQKATHFLLRETVQFTEFTQTKMTSIAVQCATEQWARHRM